jgi:hypothetical protein
MHRMFNRKGDEVTHEQSRVVRFDQSTVQAPCQVSASSRPSRVRE